MSQQNAVLPSGVDKAVARLERASTSGTPTPPVREVLGSTDVATAYAVQKKVNSRRIERGARVVGRKIGLTSPAVQKQLGVNQPDFGVLFGDMAYADGDTVPIELLLQPKIEAEVAFILAEDLDGILDLNRVTAAVEVAVAALEIVDSRVADWDITIVDTIADNGSSGLYVLGADRLEIGAVDPKAVAMTMSVNGAVASEGHGTACLGDPLEALLWLARTSQEFGDPLRAGEVVLSGALGPMVPISAGDEVRAIITGLGSVSVTFSSTQETEQK